MENLKEYLRKNSNGTYSYIGMVQPDHVSNFMIEIPQGAECLTQCGELKAFWKDGAVKFLNCDEDWDFKFGMGVDRYVELKRENSCEIVWKRYTHPEELPFIDDEPYSPDYDGSEQEESESLNDQYAEIEKVRQSHRTASEIADSALKHIRERAETYDQPTGERSAAKTAKAFNAITGKDITESEVWLLLQLLKDVRQWSREDYHQDSAEDCIAYAALKAESLEDEK